MPRGKYPRKGIKRGPYKNPREYRSRFEEWQQYESNRRSEFRDPYKDYSYGAFKHEYKMQKEQAKEYKTKRNIIADPLEWMKDRAINRFDLRTYNAMDANIFEGMGDDFIKQLGIDRKVDTSASMLRKLQEFDLDYYNMFMDKIKKDYADLKKSGLTSKQAAQIIAEYYFGS